ncbi:hypothetical protein CUMW_242200, partial [Citrus unshiu]
SSLAIPLATYSMISLGAKSDGRTDSTKAFLAAWAKPCVSTATSTIYVPPGRIGTGDDCVSVGPGTTNLWIENVACGPGHGISIGSLGKELHEAGVQNVTNVDNPIAIDQNYCPDNKNCPGKPSGVKISDMTYQDIHGSSATKVVVKFDCSPMYPCFGINLEDVKLIYKNQPAEASCRNADGSASGFVQPNSCLKL